MQQALSNTQQSFDVGALYSGTFLKAADLGGQSYLATIKAVERVEIAAADGSVRTRAALVLDGWVPKLVLNKTNFETIAAAYGRQSGGWIGKQIEVYPDITMFNGKPVEGVRVRVQRPAALAAATPSNVVAPRSSTTALAPQGGPTVAAPSPSSPANGDLVDDLPY